MTTRFASMLTLALLVLAPAAHASQDFNRSRSNKEKGVAGSRVGGGGIKKKLTANAKTSAKSAKAVQKSNVAATSTVQDFNVSRSNKDKGVAKPKKPTGGIKGSVTQKGRENK